MKKKDLFRERQICFSVREDKRVMEKRVGMGGEKEPLKMQRYKKAH